MKKRAPQTIDLVPALLRTYPELPEIAAAAADTPLYVVGGAVRDLFAGRGRTDLDLAVDGDPRSILIRLGGEAPVSHDRFQTASLTVDGLRVDLARTRRETYSRPGALPDVSPAPIEEDLARRDFTVNAMAVQVAATADSDGWRLLDPFGGRQDLGDGVLRLLHQDSIRDDPTRALRGARYAAGYELKPEPGTASQLSAARLSDVSWERRRADLIRILEDERAFEALALIESWGVASLRPGWRERAEQVRRLLKEGPWQDAAPLPEAMLASVWPEAAPSPLESIPRESPGSGAAMVALAKGRGPIELLLARADGATWLDDYMERLRQIELDIDGADLLAAGIPEGPAVGRGLKTALERKLDGRIEGRESELEVALEAAREAESSPGSDSELGGGTG